MGLLYENDVAEWAVEQAAWIRSGQFSKADKMQIAEELEGIRDSCRFELEERCAMLLARLARWNRQPGFRCELWRYLIDLQRGRVEGLLRRLPSLRALIQDPEFTQDAWLGALIKVVGEGNCYTLPDASPWPLEQALTPGFYPGEFSLELLKLDHFPS
jgi:hypothetical protein